MSKKKSKLKLAQEQAEEEYLSSHKKNLDEKEKQLITSLANLLYKIDMDDKDKHLLWKSFKGNKKFLASIEMKKKEFEFSIIETVSGCSQV